MTNLSKIFLITPTQPTFEERSMEKFTKFRDPGTGIAPFLPIAPGNRTPFILPFEIALCVIRTPLIFLLLAVEAVFVEGIGEICLRPTVPFLVAWVRWLFLRAILVLCGIWWVDEQLDGVSKSRAHCHVLSSLYSQTKLAIPPKPGNLIVSNFTSPLDVVYFAAKYDAAFVSCFVTSDKVQLTSFLTALWRSINSPLLEPPDNAMLIPLTEVTKKLPDRIIVVFPETTPTNGRALLKFSPAFQNDLVKTEKVYACNIRYTPSDITLPTPSPWPLLWRVTSFIKHSMRVRITHRPVQADLLDSLGKTGRMKSVGLGAKEKREFLEVWRKRR